MDMKTKYMIKFYMNDPLQNNWKQLSLPPPKIVGECLLITSSHWSNFEHGVNSHVVSSKLT